MNRDLHVGGAPPETTRLEQRLEEIGWGCLLVMTGALWLAPAGWVPQGSWAVGVGLILLGLDAARYLLGLKTRGFGLLVGLAAGAAGTGQLLGIDLRWLPVLVVALGTALVIKAMSGAARGEPMDAMGSGGGG